MTTLYTKTGKGENGFSNRMFINGLEKVVVSVGVGKLSTQPHFTDKVLSQIMDNLALITGQRPAPRPARKSVAGFKIRAGDIVGVKVTLRGKRMAAFFKKVVHVVLPRIRDFRGVRRRSIDGSGNLSIGIRESVVFPEINPDVSQISFGVAVTVVPKKIMKFEEAIQLYSSLGVPFEKSR